MVESSGCKPGSGSGLLETEISKTTTNVLIPSTPSFRLDSEYDDNVSNWPLSKRSQTSIVATSEGGVRVE